MSAATIAALSTTIPAILAAITALITAVKGNNKAAAANAKVNDHIFNPHAPAPVIPPGGQGDSLP